MAHFKFNLLLLMAVIVGFSLVGNQLIFEKPLHTERSPASYHPAIRSFAAVSVQALMAEKIAQSTNRMLASIGKQPNPLDKFRFGMLEGKYALTLSGEKIKDIEFINTPNSEGSPTQVADRLEFLKSNAQLLNIKTEIEKLQTEVVGRRIVEIFSAKAADSKEVVKIQIEIDELDRLYRVSTLELNKVF